MRTCEARTGSPPHSPRPPDFLRGQAQRIQQWRDKPFGWGWRDGCRGVGAGQALPEKLSEEVSSEQRKEPKSLWEGWKGTRSHVALESLA